MPPRSPQSAHPIPALSAATGWSIPRGLIVLLAAARGAAAVTDIVATRPDATALDLAGFSTPTQRLVVALALLDDLWARRDERRPVLLVIDEAHNLASPQLDSPIAAAVRERLIQIAAEGRKYGRWLPLSTQRPSKVHPGASCPSATISRS
ncbi:ATP-binding protein [Nocardia uniformis]|uniref:ATP-binding protein n=1 Tax=Nocardia uniformis TaxID=53432 RepID=UPI0008379192|nr:ATP-binding protein [Nocardia uniformis]